MPALEQVAGEVGRAIAPHLDAEDFVTAALAQIAPCGELTIVNCGHQPPLLRLRGELQPLTDGKAPLPLGLEDGFTAATASWSPGDRLLLYTDGLVESRDAHGTSSQKTRSKRRFSHLAVIRHWIPLMRAVDRHTGGHAHDDTACAMRPGQRSRETTEPLCSVTLSATA
jgi:serine phosphatase RsbU (regulator of sigma subunit)